MKKHKALEILHKNMHNQNLRRHCYAVGCVMGSIYDHLNETGQLEKDNPGREAWEVLGILHDADYEITKDDWTKHTILLLEWLEKDGVTKDDPLYMAVQSHNNKITNLREPQTQMEWALECCDELTGFIVACALVMPEKKLSAVQFENVKKKWPQKAFAKGVIREQIEQCEDKLNIKIDDFINIALVSMKNNSQELGI